MSERGRARLAALACARAHRLVDDLHGNNPTQAIQQRAHGRAVVQHSWKSLGLELRHLAKQQRSRGCATYLCNGSRTAKFTYGESHGSIVELQCARRSRAALKHAFAMLQTHSPCLKPTPHMLETNTAMLETQMGVCAKGETSLH
eukprot:6203301-Pleurochrysis_carterae.AAC.2